MKTLFADYTIKNMTLKNRIVMAPMCMFCAKEDGKITDWHIEHYVSRAAGGVGLIIVEATAITPDGRISEQDLGIWSDEQINGLTTLVNRVHSYGCKIGIQLAHAGRKSKSAIKPVSVSEIAFNKDYKTPRKLNDRDIEIIAESFQKSAKRALEIGFDFIEIHAAHGYLLNVFLSPLTNNRKDKWGGSTKKRFHIIELIVKNIRTVWQDEKPLGIRISANDYTENGISEQDVDYIAKRCGEIGIDVINVSSGGVVETPINSYPGYQVPLAEYIKNKNNISVIAGGLLESIDLATEIVENKRADLIYMGRALLRNPYWVIDKAERLGITTFTQEQYKKAYK